MIETVNRPAVMAIFADRRRARHRATENGPVQPAHPVRAVYALLSLCCYSFKIWLDKAGWIGHLKSNKLNATVTGVTDDLESFMFGTSRAVIVGGHGYPPTIAARPLFLL
jgi:hypothetical protein